MLVLSPPPSAAHLAADRSFGRGEPLPADGATSAGFCLLRAPHAEEVLFSPPFPLN